jgi:hypothetical protein
MVDPIRPNPAVLTPAPAPTFDQLHRWVEGLLDGEILLAEEGVSLLESIALARRHQQAGEVEATRRYTTRVVQAIEKLVGSGFLGEAHGRVALALASPLLGDEPGSSERGKDRRDER